MKCIRRCGLDVTDLILQPMASADAVLTDDEKELGVVLVDIGGGTTDIAIFTEGAIRHTAVIPIAGDQITNDIAMALRTPTGEAEEIKVRYGIAKQVLADPTDVFDVPGLGDRGARNEAATPDDIEAAAAAAVEAGGEIAHPPMELPGHGKFAIYIQGGIHHGLWQL